MKNLNIVGPYIGDPFFYADWKTGKVEFIGKLATHHEVVIKQYIEPFAAALDSYWKENKSKELVFNLKLTYFNTSGSKHLLNFFKLLEDYKNKLSANITVNWFYLKEDLDMVEVVGDYGDLVELKFVLHAVEGYEYWDNLNLFTEFVSEPANFSVIKEITNLLAGNGKIQNAELMMKVENIISKFLNNIKLIPEFEFYIMKRLQYLLEQETEHESIEKIMNHFYNKD